MDVRIQIDYQRLVGDERVHGRLHADPQVFADEMDRIFTQGWAFVGHESEVPEAGDWVTRRLGLEPVIMVRDRAGSVNVLVNRCSHRGTSLCWEAKGHSASFQCNYHAWTFGLDGELRSVPYPGGFEKDKADLGLDRAGQVDGHRGFVFANLDGRAGPLADHLGPGGAGLIDRLCDLSPIGTISLAAGWIGHRVESNWKLWPESDNDGYHLKWVHASMVDTTDTYYEEAVLGGETGNRSLAVDWGNGHVELDFRPSYQTELAWLGTTREKVGPYCTALEEAGGEERARRLLWDGPPHALVFPNLFLGEMNVAIIEPVSTNEMVHRHTAVQLDGVDDAFNRRLRRQSEAAMGPAGFIVADDAVTAERIQMAMPRTGPDHGDAVERGWIDMSRGAKREEPGGQGQRQALVSDETTNRGFWWQYRQVMSGR